MHHEVVRQLSRPQVDGVAGRPSYGLVKQKVAVVLTLTHII